MNATAGFAPTVKVGPPENPERAKYVKVWELADYRNVSPGELAASLFIERVKPDAESTCIDFGCGTGRGAMMLAAIGSLKVTMLDFAGNCLDPEVRQACETQPDYLRFREHDLTLPIPETARYGYCCDVMEHIPEEDVPAVLENILASAEHVFFSIATADDVLGAEIGEKLHMTVKPREWWEQKFRELEAVVHWTQDESNGFFAYATSWKDVSEVLPPGRINTPDDVINAQVEANIASGWTHARPYPRQEREIALLCGGPSLNDCVDQIRALREAGAAIITTNGSYHWALERGIKVSGQIVLDAREFNARFTRPVLDDCKYLIASQVHPSTLEGLPKERTVLWHVGISERCEVLAKEAAKYFYPIAGGSTVTLRAIPLLRMLGFYKMHLFGFDSCIRTAKDHHAYSQPENDTDAFAEVSCGKGIFRCTGWQIAQANEFRDLIRMIGDQIELEVYGDGLIAAIVREGAELSIKE